jgi:hypothetical protein
MTDLIAMIVMLAAIGVLGVIVTLQAATIRQLKADEAERERFRLEAKQRLLESFMLSASRSEKLNQSPPGSRQH